ncbi:MAG: hypothetical protein K0S76_1037 [Herbinix sp.]|jgi:hypothetical protein|nr:hypothetical protein [Herbinix sp.]
MKVEFKRDLHHNYMVMMQIENSDNDSYCIKMLSHSTIEGLLCVDRRIMDNEVLFYYDISAKQSLNHLLEKSLVSYDKMKQLLVRIVKTIEKAFEYLLPEDDFILMPEYIYMEVASEIPHLCYLPGYQKNIKEQITSLLEFFMNKVDYNDKEAVLLVYRLYAASREEGFTFESLLYNLYKEHTETIKNHRTQGSNNNKLKSEDHVEEELTTDREASTLNRPESSAKVIKHKYGDFKVSCSSMMKRLKKSLNIKSRQIVTNQHELNQHELNQHELNQHKTNQQEINQHITYNKQSNTNQHKVNQHITDKMETDWEKADRQIVKRQITSKQLANRRITGRKITDRKITNKKITKTTNRELHDKTGMYKKAGSPVMLEKLMGEQEISCYPVKTYLYSGICILGGIVLLTAGFITRIIYNSFGNRIDTSKLLALLLLVLGLELYVHKKLWDKKNRITKIVSKEEYIDPRGDSVNMIQQSKDGAENFQKVREVTCEEAKECNPTCVLNSEERPPSVLLQPIDSLQYKTITLAHTPFFIGKLRKNVDFCLEKEVVSRYHAKISKEAQQYYLTDLNSTNGTFINREALAPYQTIELKDGDEIAFADIKYQFLIQL